MSDCKRVYRFGTDAQGTCVTEGDKSMNFVLGGKGANLAEMSRIGLPVPGGFTITCQTCVEYSGAGNVWPEGALDEIVAAEADLEARCGKKLGDARDPLLVSVRSGAPFSMPGMMDTVLNLGLNDDSVQGLIAQTQNPRFAWDSYRRFIQMFSNVVMGVDADLFENALTQARLVAGVRIDSELSEFYSIFSSFIWNPGVAQYIFDKSSNTYMSTMVITKPTNVTTTTRIIAVSLVTQQFVYKIDVSWTTGYISDQSLYSKEFSYLESLSEQDESDIVNIIGNYLNGFLGEQ